jgi:hypothetical protein
VIVSDKNSLFELGIKKNLKLCAVALSIPICIRAGCQSARILLQPIILIFIPNTGCIVNKIFCFKPDEMLVFWE